MNRSGYQRLYETERQLPNRNYAKDHSFDEWLQRERSVEHMVVVEHEALEARLKAVLSEYGVAVSVMPIMVHETRQ